MRRRPAFLGPLLVPGVVVFLSCRGSTPPVASRPASAIASASPSSSTALAHADGGASDPRVRLGHDEQCALPAGTRGDARPGFAPFTRASGSCVGSDPFCDTVDKPPDPKDACFVANDNLARAERDTRRTRAPSPEASGAWDGKSAPRYLDRVDAHLHLADEEQALLRKNHFVVLDRLAYGSYAVAFHDVFQQQLPVYVGVDSILNAVYQASQMLLMDIETTRLAPKLFGMLARMRATLAASKGLYTKETIDDLDLYLTVADKLFVSRDDETKKPRPIDADAEALAAKAVAAGELEPVELFGRARMIDFSQFAPRGYYTGASSLGGQVQLGKNRPASSLPQYFRAMMWLSRLELNLVSRSCRSSQPGALVEPAETPREARDAIALADLAARAGALDDLRAFETTYSVFAGRREDVSVFELLALSAKAAIAPNDPNAQPKLAAAIGDKWKRTARTHYMPEGATDLPVIATLFGPRIVPDIAPLTGLVHDRIPDRTHLGFADVAYLLGHDRAKSWLASDLARYPSLAAALDGGRAELAASAQSGKDVYSTWIRAVARLAEPPAPAVPSFMKTDAYADMRMSSALAGYAQIRHTFVLLAGQGYDAYGCEIPDGWVEPALGTYDGLLGWVRAARVAAPERAAYFRRVEEILGMLRSISQTELAGAPLSEPQRRWLGMISEFTPVGGYSDSGEPPKYTGWYFDLFPDREHGAEREIDLVADYFTLTNEDEVRYLGVEKAAMGVFVVDSGGEPRAMVGPVTKPYELATPIAGRLDDARARKSKDKRAPWLSYLAPAKPEPPLSVELVFCTRDTRVIVTSTAPSVGPVTITLLDHHGDPIAAPVTHAAGREPVAFAYALAADAEKAVEGVRIAVKDLAIAGVGKGRWDLVGGASVYRAGDASPPRRDLHFLTTGSMMTREPD